MSDAPPSAIERAALVKDIGAHASEATTLDVDVFSTSVTVRVHNPAFQQQVGRIEVTVNDRSQPEIRVTKKIPVAHADYGEAQQLLMLADALETMGRLVTFLERRPGWAPWRFTMAKARADLEAKNAPDYSDEPELFGGGAHEETGYRATG
jgi:hypothetical protein